MGKSRIPEWHDYISNQYSQYKPKWILIKDDNNIKNIIIQSLLNKQYILKYSDTGKKLKLYERKVLELN